MARLEIEHIVPLAKGGSNDESKQWTLVRRESSTAKYCQIS